MTDTSDNGAPDRLNNLVTTTATRLLGVTAATSAAVSQEILADLVAEFGGGIGFLRHDDSKLVAVWPPHSEVPGDDGGVTSITSVPLLAGDVTTGELGFVGIDEWSAAETKAIKGIAALFALTQARVDVEEHLRYLAEHDDLTGLLNRRACLAHLDQRLAPGEPGPVCVLFLDLDRLKAVNDYLGHGAGDQFIRTFADRIREGTDDHWVIARLGGDEFVVVPRWPVPVDDAEVLATKLQARLCERVSIDGEPLTRTVSIGIALGNPGEDKTRELLHRADQALLAAKADGGNKVSRFSERMSLESQFRNDIELHLQDSIENGSLRLHYQPEIDLRTGKILATEALVRWQHRVHGLLLPDTFIGVAESVNLAGELGRWVLRAACAEFKRWRDRGLGHDIILRVNVSPAQLVTDGFVDSVAKVLHEFNLDGNSVCLEITESVVVEDIDATRSTLTDLKTAGIRIAIDDFGTGYSVLTHLKSLPVNTLKIDKSFVRDLGFDPDDLSIVRAIIGLADAFNLGLVAEGVETVLAARTLLEHGCYRAQGFLLSRPLPGDAMAELLAKGSVPVDF